MQPRLIVAATRMEVEPLLQRLQRADDQPLVYGEGRSGMVGSIPVSVAWFGLGKANTAAGVALAVRELQPAAVVQLGIGGAFSGSKLRPGDCAVASEEVHLDLGARTADGFEDLTRIGFPLLAGTGIYNRLPLESAFARELASKRWPLLAFGTSETVTGISEEGRLLEERFGVAVESMEGAAAAQVCLALSVPFAEVRGISNLVGERDRSAWRLNEAVTVANEVVVAWLCRGGWIPEQESTNRLGSLPPD